MLKLELDMIQAIGLAVILLIIGRFLRKKIRFFEKYCIPAPVIGGFLHLFLNNQILWKLNLILHYNNSLW